MTQENPAVHEGASVTSTPASTPPPTDNPVVPSGATIAPATVPEGETSRPADGPAPAQGTTAFTPQPTSTPPGNVGAGVEGDPNRVASTSGEIPQDSLRQMARTEQANPLLADKTQVIVVDGKEAAATPPGDTGPFGQALAPGGEVAGGNVIKTLEPPPLDTAINQALTKERAALLSPIGRKLSGFIQRPPAEWGLLGPGDIVRGHMLLLDLNTGEKVRGMDDHRIGEGKLYANLRNLPESLATGDTIEQVLAEAHV